MSLCVRVNVCVCVQCVTNQSEKKPNQLPHRAAPSFLKCVIIIGFNEQLPG